MSRYTSRAQMAPVIETWLETIRSDAEIVRLSQALDTTVEYRLTDLNFSFHTDFVHGVAGGGLDPAKPPSKVQLGMTSDVFDKMMSGEIDATVAALTGQLTFSGDMGAAMGLEALFDPMQRLYTAARTAQPE